MTQQHRDWFAERFRDSRLIALGDPRGNWRRWRPRMLLRRLRQSATTASLVSAAVSTSAGVALAVSPGAPVSVAFSSSGYSIGGTTLHSSDGITYTGSAVLVVRHVGAALRAAASTSVAGRHVVGVCDMTGAREQTCRFTIGGTVTTSHDRYDAGHWLRTYADGQTVEIDAAPGVPVPFPIGR